jgi:hypothetical protein
MAGYRDLRRNAVGMRLEGVPVQVASVADLIRCKEATHRPKDLEVLPTLRRLLEGQELDRALRMSHGSTSRSSNPPDWRCDGVRHPCHPGQSPPGPNPSAFQRSTILPACSSLTSTGSSSPRPGTWSLAVALPSEPRIAA